MCRFAFVPAHVHTPRNSSPATSNSSSNISYRLLPSPPPSLSRAPVSLVKICAWSTPDPNFGIPPSPRQLHLNRAYRRIRRNSNPQKLRLERLRCAHGRRGDSGALRFARFTHSSRPTHDFAVILADAIMG
ncbi:hypothetical protein EXIGLDRAFT_155600 [Exidia glandulosa HHB12029]|uniref:Uncharacterized protein n=1 Tax=Exidia glandulosa HHB12029 TaxID=1314781 RepID=A0A165QIW9_EXIGL|nr:hypothetical protein EXIGLDRAFT_155600 [Exidia glandulosa HHB12029]